MSTQPSRTPETDAAMNLHNKKGLTAAHLKTLLAEEQRKNATLEQQRDAARAEVAAMKAGQLAKTVSGTPGGITITPDEVPESFKQGMAELERGEERPMFREDAVKDMNEFADALSGATEIADLRSQLDAARAEVKSLREIMACANTPMMRDVLKELEAAKKACPKRYQCSSSGIPHREVPVTQADWDEAMKQLDAARKEVERLEKEALDSSEDWAMCGLNPEAAQTQLIAERQNHRATKEQLTACQQENERYNFTIGTLEHALAEARKDDSKELLDWFQAERDQRGTPLVAMVVKKNHDRQQSEWVNANDNIRTAIRTAMIAARSANGKDAR